jgi:hypothetical protein
VKTIVAFLLLIFFALPASLGATMAVSALVLIGYLDATMGASPLLQQTPALLAQLYAGTTPTYASAAAKDFVESWKTYIDAVIAGLKASFGISVPAGYVGPFLAAVGTKILAYFPATAATPAAPTP